MRAVILLAATLAPVAALAQVPGNSYLPQPDQKTAIARSITEGLEMGVPAKALAPWWNVVVLPATKTCAGGAYIEIEPVMRNLPTVGMDDFTANPRAPIITAGRATFDKDGVAQRQAPTGLTDDEKATLITYADLVKQGCI